jgi:hypothetical protein
VSVLQKSEIEIAEPPGSPFGGDFSSEAELFGARLSLMAYLS